jgi:hypothetical protein
MQTSVRHDAMRTDKEKSSTLVIARGARPMRHNRVISKKIVSCFFVISPHVEGSEAGCVDENTEWRVMGLHHDATRMVRGIRKTIAEVW